MARSMNPDCETAYRDLFKAWARGGEVPAPRNDREEAELRRRWFREWQRREGVAGKWRAIGEAESDAGPVVGAARLLP